ncbi:MAG: hypothetical protein V1667_02600, partial [bacterium]
MDIKSIVIRLTVDADMRAKLLLQFPHILDGYILTNHGEVLSREEAKQLDAHKYLLDGLSFV